MIILLITIAVLIVSPFILYKIEWYDDVLWVVAAMISTAATIAIVVEIIVMICSHVGVEPQIQQIETQYQSLIERREIAQSEYEDYSKSDVVRDIAEWNKEVISAQYWGHNPWTSWFYSQRVDDSLKIIE